MPRRSITSTYRRHAQADFKFRFSILIMRSYSFYLRVNIFCVVFLSFFKCEQYVRYNRQYKLAFPVDQLDKLSEQENKLLDQIIKSETRIRRLCKQRRLLLKKIRDLGDREAQNIFKLEINKMLSKIPVKFIEVLNPFSPRFFSFFDFALLDFSNRILAELFSS